jgi:uncharacterized protein (TIGR02246 family)
MTEKALSSEDRFAIQDLLGRLYYALDTGDAETIISLFTEDGVMISGNGDRYENIEGIRSFAEESVSDPTSRGRQHVARPLYVFPNGDGWTQRSYMAVYYWDPASGEKRIRSMSGSDDTCVKTKLGWKIKSRHNTTWNGKSLPWVGP